MTTLIFFLLISMPNTIQIETNVGLGGIVYETPLPAIDSNIGLSFGLKKKIIKDLWIGGSFYYNAYSGDNTFHIGPGELITDFMVYKNFKLDEWNFQIGAGVALNFLFSYRKIPIDNTEFTPGDYTLTTPGISAGISIMMLKRIDENLQIGIGVKYYSGVYFNTCWHGPVKDCNDVDSLIQNWFIGITIIYDLK
jgi:hypothetical protein